ncbi:hypothetical protein NMG60_11032837 [Bertholletia excelsa]
MARCAKPSTFVLLALLLSPFLAEARGVKFLGKAEAPVLAPSVSVSPSPSPSLPYSPSPSPASAPEIVPPESRNGYYGLFSHESTEFPPVKKTTTATTTTSIGGQEKKFQSEGLAEDFEKEETREKPYNSYSNNNNNAYSNNNNYYNMNGYGGNSYRNNNAYSNNNNYYNTNGYGSNSYNSVNGYELTQKQGMSDTRFLEKGKYYYPVNNNNQNNNYYTTSSKYGNGYETETISSRGRSNDGYEVNFSNSQTNSNEFDSMEEYERQQGYPEIQGQYIP